MDNDSTPREVGLSEGLGPLLQVWANTEGVRFVSRSHGQCTTSTVSVDSLLELMKTVRAAERERLRMLVEAVRTANGLAEDGDTFRLLNYGQERAWIALLAGLEGPNGVGKRPSAAGAWSA